MNKRGIDEIPTVNAASPYIMPFSSLRSSLSVSPVAITKGSIGQERRETCKQAEEKIQIGWLPTHVQLQRDFAPPKGGERPAALTPATGSRRLAAHAIAPRRRSLIGRFGLPAGLVPLRQTFVRCRQAGAATMPLRFSSLRRRLLLVAVNHEKGEPHKHSEALGFI